MNINEHLWSGIIHRSETGEERKEDNVNLLDFDGLYNYLNKHYKSKDNAKLFKQIRSLFKQNGIKNVKKSIYCYPCTQPKFGPKVDVEFNTTINTCTLRFYLKNTKQEINVQQVVNFIKTDGFEMLYQDDDGGDYIISTPDNKSFIKLWNDVISVINDCNVEKVKN